MLLRVRVVVVVVVHCSLGLDELFFWVGGILFVRSSELSSSGLVGEFAAEAAHDDDDG